MPAILYAFKLYTEWVPDPTAVSGYSTLVLPV